MEILLALGIFVVAFLLGGLYGWNLRERIAMKIVDQALKNAKVDTHAEMIQIVVEKHKDCLFIYNKESNEFMAQGSTMKELNDALESRFPGKRFSCSEEHLEMIKAL